MSDDTLFGELRRLAEGEDMDVPQLDFDKLWEEHYSDYFQNIARKWSYLQTDGSAEDLYQDLWEKVYTRAMETWPKFFRTSKDPKFDNWVRRLVHNYIVDLARRKKTGPQQMIQKQRSLDAPMEGEEGDNSTLLDFMSKVDRAFDNLESSDLIERILEHIDDPDQRTAIKVLLEDGTMTEKMDRIKSLTGRSPAQIMRLLRENPAISRLLGYTGPKPSRTQETAPVVDEVETVEDEDALV